MLFCLYRPLFFACFLLVFYSFAQAQGGIRISNRNVIGVSIDPPPPSPQKATKAREAKNDKPQRSATTAASPTTTAASSPPKEVVKLEEKAKEDSPQVVLNNDFVTKDADDAPASSTTPTMVNSANAPEKAGKMSRAEAKEAARKASFTTLESIEQDYVKVKKAAKVEKLKRTVTNLATDSKKAKPSLTPEKVRLQRDSIHAISREINTLQDEEDSLDFVYERDYLTYKPAFFCNFGATRARAFFDIIYGNNGSRFKALSNTGINLGGNTASLYSEILSGNLGLFRVSMGTMISNSRQDSTRKVNLQHQDEAYQRLATYGGNTVLNIEYPVLFLHSPNSQYNLIGRTILKGTADFPAFGTNTTKWAGSGAVGFDLYGDAALNNDKLRFFFNANTNGIMGTEQFIKNLGISNDKFVFGQVSVGLVFLQNYKISLIIYTISSEAALQNRAVIAGGQVLR